MNDQTDGAREMVIGWIGQLMELEGGPFRRPEPGFWLGVIWDLDCLRLSSSWTPTSLCRMRS